MTETNHTIAVAPCTITFEGVTLADGTTLAVELSEPRQRYAILVTTGETVEIIAMHDDETEAVAAAQRLEGQLQAMARVPEGVTIQ